MASFEIGDCRSMGRVVGTGNLQSGQGTVRSWVFGARALVLVLAAALWVAAMARPRPAIGADLVVLDPGHGGHLEGARTRDGVLEKDIVLRVAEHAKRALEQSGHRVILTRSDDRHVELKDRIGLAHREGARVFVSIHGNYSPVRLRRGVETYVLSAAASDESSLTLAHVENEGESLGPSGADDGFGGGAFEGEQGDLERILMDLERLEAHEESGLLALAVQESLGRTEGFGPSRGLRQAPFRVLRGARMPAVLIEIGYLSHPRQGAFLATPKAAEAAGGAIARGIERFLGERR